MARQSCKEVTILVPRNLLQDVKEVAERTLSKPYRFKVHELLVKEAIEPQWLEILVNVPLSILAGIFANALWNFLHQLSQHLEQSHQKQKLDTVQIFNAPKERRFREGLTVYTPFQWSKKPKEAQKRWRELLKAVKSLPPKGRVVAGWVTDLEYRCWFVIWCNNEERLYFRVRQAKLEPMTEDEGFALYRYLFGGLWGRRDGLSMFFGMWSHREDMQNGAEWVQRMREKWQERAFRWV